MTAASALTRTLAAIPRWALLLFAALVARAATFGNPLVHVDEEFYFVTAQQMLNGALPYVDVWDRKPIGLFLIYLPAAALGVPLGIWAYQAMALACVVFTALLIARIADRAGWGAGGVIGGALYIFCLNLADGQGGQSPVFYNLAVVAAFALVMPRIEDRLIDWQRIARAIAAMLLLGIAMQIKYSAVFEGVFLGLWLLWREHRLGGRPGRIVALGLALNLVAMAPTAAALGAYAAMGHLDAFAYANFGSILHRQSDPWFRLLGAFLKAMLILSPLLILSGLSRHIRCPNRTPQDVRNMVFGWLIASMLGFLVFGSWFNHYTLPVMVPAALCASGYLGDPRGRKWALSVLFAMLAIGQAVVLTSLWIRGDARQIEAMAGAMREGDGCLYVYSGTSMLYGYTGRCVVTPWIFPSHLARDRENGALGVDQMAEIDRIFTQKPRYVVMRPVYIGERIEVRERVLGHLKAQGYRLKGRWPIGNLMLDLYEAQATGAAPIPARASSSS